MGGDGDHFPNYINYLKSFDVNLKLLLGDILVRFSDGYKNDNK